MLRLRGSLFDLRKGERTVALLMGANYYLLLLFYYLLKPARDSLFLVELTPERLPLVYVLTALVAAPVTAAYARAGMKHRLDRLILLTTIFLVLNLVGLYWLLPVGRAWVFYFFYAWVGVAGGLTTSQFWLQANGVFDAAQAKRIFPLLGLGGIAGAFTGGEVTSFLVVRMGLTTQGLLLVSAGVLALAGVLGGLVWRQKSLMRDAIPEYPLEGPVRGTALKDIVRSILRSRHLSLTVGILALTVMTASFIDFQFKIVSWEAYPDGAALTSFLGRFYGRMSLVSLLVQISFAPRLLRRFGVGNTLLALPAVLFGGAAAMVMMPGLGAAMALRGGDFALKYSLDKTSRELLFLPIPLALKKRTKVFIDMFVDRWARGMAGGLLLVLTAVVGPDLRIIAAFTLGLLVIWIALALLMRREYVNSFRRALTRRDMDLRGLRVRIDDAAALKVLVGTLASGKHREVIYALDMLQGAASPMVGEAVRPLLAHTAPEVRRRAVDLLALNAVPSDHERVRRMVRDVDLDTRVSAVAFVLGDPDLAEGADDFLRVLLASDGMARNAAISYIARRDTDPSHRSLITRRVVDAIRACNDVEGCEGRRVLASLPWVPADTGTDLWDELLVDPDPTVVDAAIIGIGLRGERGRVPWLLEKLGDPQLHIQARSALSALAVRVPAVIGDLEAFLVESAHLSRQRAEIPRALAAVPHQDSVEVLVRRLATQHPNLRYEVLKALGKLRAGYPELKFDRDIISREICLEAARCLQLARVRAMLPGTGEAPALLRRTIVETEHLRLESVFRLLGLLYPARDLLNAYHGVVSDRRVLRANAREFLDNLLAGGHRQLVLSLLDEQPIAAGVCESLAELDREFADPITNAQEGLTFLGRSCDPWLAACAIFAGAAVENTVAAIYLKRTGDDMLTPIEKVLVLQGIEIFGEVPTDKLAALAAISREVSYLAGDTVYRENDAPDALYLVLEGSVRLSEGERTVSVAGPQVSFGTWALFDDRPRQRTAVAGENSRVLRICRNEFNDLLSDDVRIARGIIRTIARKFRELTEPQ